MEPHFFLVESSDLTNNYRPIASLVAAMSNIFQFCTLSILEPLLATKNHYLLYNMQLHDMCIYTTKSVVKHSLSTLRTIYASTSSLKEFSGFYIPVSVASKKHEYYSCFFGATEHSIRLIIGCFTRD